ncbi:MAG: preprotein translocase subunit SecD, partial [Acidimicrobiales bacterium]
GAVRCFEIVGDKLAAGDAVESARAVALNRQPAVELQMTSELRALINNHFASSTNPLGLAIEVGGFVLSAPQIQRPPVSDRLVVSGGFSVDSAERLAEILNS